MKKKMVYLKEWINLTAIKRRVANAFSEKGLQRGVKDAAPYASGFLLPFVVVSQ